MFVGVLRIECIIPISASLKDKRQAIRSLKDKLAWKFNVSVAEVGFQEKWQRAAIGVAVVSGEEAHLQRSLNEISAFVREFPAIRVVSIHKEVLDEGSEAQEDFGAL
ncbi:MAG: DUF503 domain-containing protein [Candidatus Brocadiia bacterium]